VTSPAIPRPSRLLANIFTSRAMTKNLGGEVRTGVQQMLAIVEDQHEATLFEILFDSLERRSPRVVFEA